MADAYSSQAVFLYATTFDGYEFDVEDILKKTSRQHSKLLYKIVILVLFALQVLNLFGASNNAERIASIILIVLLFVLSKIPGKVGNWINVLYICFLIICMLGSTIMQKPFMGIFSGDHSSTKFYDKFAQGFYDYSIGNYQEALRIYKDIKPYVPEEETLEYYMWYIDAASCAEEIDLAEQLKKEITEKITSPIGREAKLLFKFLPLGSLVNDINQENYENLLQGIFPYQNANEEIFILCEILAYCHSDTGVNREILEELFLKLQNCEDNFENYNYIKEGTLKLIIDDVYISEPDLAVIALSDLYARNHAGFFEEYIWVYPLYYNFGNIRWVSMDRLESLQQLFKTGWNIFQDSENTLYLMYKEKILNLGMFLGVTEVISELESRRDDFSKIDSTIMNYSEDAVLYNILPIENDRYVFTVFVSESSDVDMAERADFYTIDLNSDHFAEPIIINGEHLQQSVMMGKLFLLEYSGISKKYINVNISGTFEYLQLAVLDLSKGTFTYLENTEGTYHCGDFSYDADSKTCQWGFEIYNAIDANIQTKVGGNILSTIDFDNLTVKTKSDYFDPALQFYVKERNEQLIFPLANLNRLGGCEIKDEILLELIRANSIPYYHYSNIQGTIKFWSDFYLPNLSGIVVSYISETDNLSDFQYFFLVKREMESIKLLGLYKISDGKLTTVY